MAHSARSSDSTDFTIQAQGQTGDAAVRRVPVAFAAAWAKHDGHQLAKVMSEDVDFVNVGGDWLHGRKDFELYHGRLLSGRFRESTITPLETAVASCARIWPFFIEAGESKVTGTRT